MASAIPAPADAFLDIGTGAGIPGLVLALAWADARGVLLDSRIRRTAFLEEAVRELGLTGRCTVLTGRAETVARDPRHRGAYDLVVARGFGAPAVTAECAVGFLRPGGRLAVSEPPDTDPADRWPAPALDQLGLWPPELHRTGDASVATLRLSRPPDDRWPRRAGIPAKRPLW